MTFGCLYVFFLYLSLSMCVCHWSAVRFKLDGMIWNLIPNSLRAGLPRFTPLCIMLIGWCLRYLGRFTWCFQGSPSDAALHFAHWSFVICRSVHLVFPRFSPLCIMPIGWCLWYLGRFTRCACGMRRAELPRFTLPCRRTSWNSSKMRTRQVSFACLYLRRIFVL